MSYHITKNARLRAHIDLPASKSMSNRALVINALAHGDSQLQHLSDCDDTMVMTRALNNPQPVTDIMAAGTAMRFLSAYYAVTPGTHIITGTARMKQRPISILVNALRELGAQVEYVEKEGFPPLRIVGAHHQGGTISLPGNVSSQYISALLMIGPALQHGLQLELTGEIVSKPYINMTLAIMMEFGARVAWTDDTHISVEPHPYQCVPYFIESDWSAASYWYEMIALSDDEEAQVVLPGLFTHSLQGDSAVAHLYEKLGVGTEFFKNEDGIECARLFKQGVSAERMDYDFINEPDLAQTLVVTCAMLNIPFTFTGLQSLKIKETDRMAALINELGKLGFPLTEQDDSVLSWDGTRTEMQANAGIDTYEDHRMAMAFAPCCLKLNDIIINNPQVVSKSYPGYWEHLKACGFNIEEE